MANPMITPNMGPGMAIDAKFTVAITAGTVIKMPLAERRPVTGNDICPREMTNDAVSYQ
jgi:hypothetical protein